MKKEKSILDALKETSYTRRETDMVTFKELQMIRFYAERVRFNYRIVRSLCAVLGEKFPLKDNVVDFDLNQEACKRP
jgi:hypothetical protein